MTASASARTLLDTMEPGAIPPTLPFRVSNAYGVRPPAAATRAEPVARIAPAQPRRDDAVDSAALKARQKIAPLVGAKVEGSAIRGDDPAPKQQHRPDALPLYRRPADKNAAATGVALGRSIDVSV